MIIDITYLNLYPKKTKNNRIYNTFFKYVFINLFTLLNDGIRETDFKRMYSADS